MNCWRFWENDITFYKYENDPNCIAPIVVVSFLEREKRKAGTVLIKMPEALLQRKKLELRKKIDIKP